MAASVPDVVCCCSHLSATAAVVATGTVHATNATAAAISSFFFATAATAAGAVNVCDVLGCAFAVTVASDFLDIAVFVIGFAVTFSAVPVFAIACQKMHVALFLLLMNSFLVLCLFFCPYTSSWNAIKAASWIA